MEHMAQHHPNNGTTWRWAFGLGFGALMGLAAWALNANATRLEMLTELNQARGERLATVEADTRNIKTEMTVIQEQLREIDRKLSLLVRRQQ